MKRLFKSFTRLIIWNAEYYVPKYQKKLKEVPFGTIKKFSKKSLIVPKKIQVKNTQIAKVGILSCFQGSGRRFYNFG